MRRVELWDINGPLSYKAGELVEGWNACFVDVPERYGFARVIHEPMRVMNRAAAISEIRPGNARYFDECALSLSRSFALRPAKGHEDDPMFERARA